MTWLLSLLIGLLVILLITVATGYFVAQEFAYMAVDRSRLAARSAAGDRSADRALAITRRTSFMLSGAQLGITVTGLLIGYVAEPLVGNSLGTLLGGVGVPAAVSIAVGTVLALAISTIVQMIFGELFPKNYTIAAPMDSSLALARSTQIYLLLFGWLIKFFDWSANSLLRLLRIEPVHDVDSSATAEELGYIVSSSKDSGDLSDDMYLALDRALDFPDRDVEHAMIPRSRADVVHPTTTLAEVREIMATQHTRLPVISEDHAPIGVVHMLDLLIGEFDPETPVTELMRQPVVLPELMALPDAVRELRHRDEQLACVIDEYGGFAGLVTIEDLAEEVLGEITDEHDVDAHEEIVAVGEQEWMVDGDAHLDEVQRAVGHALPEGDYETMSGLLISHAGHLPEEGEVHDVILPAEPSDFAEGDAIRRTLQVTVEAVERHVPSAVRVRLIETQPENAGGER